MAWMTAEAAVAVTAGVLAFGYVLAVADRRDAYQPS